MFNFIKLFSVQLCPVLSQLASSPESDRGSCSGIPRRCMAAGSGLESRTGTTHHTKHRGQNRQTSAQPPALAARHAQQPTAYGCRPLLKILWLYGLTHSSQYTGTIKDVHCKSWSTSIGTISPKIRSHHVLALFPGITGSSILFLVLIFICDMFFGMTGSGLSSPTGRLSGTLSHIKLPARVSSRAPFAPTCCQHSRQGDRGL